MHLFGAAVRVLTVLLALAIGAARTHAPEVSAVAAISAVRRSGPAVSLTAERPALQRALPGKPLLDLHAGDAAVLPIALPAAWGALVIAAALPTGTIETARRWSRPLGAHRPPAVARGPPRFAV